MDNCTADQELISESPLKIPICVLSGEGHLLVLLRKFVNISVDLMTRGPPFGITQAYEAGEEGVHNIWPPAPLWTNGN